MAHLYSFDGLPAFVEQEDLPAIAVWLTDAQYIQAL
ncbi:hypothetical protein KCP74_20225 [Salmonella enterica subsp. enterica]|nr:hypothetical protein KCP74_20225 [Salmonella enterica subsp. enterica]